MLFKSVKIATAITSIGLALSCIWWREMIAGEVATRAFAIWLFALTVTFLYQLYSYNNLRGGINTNYIGLNIKMARIENGVTQAQLAQDLGVNRSMIAQIERGYKTPPLAIAIMIADRFNTTVDALTKAPR